MNIYNLELCFEPVVQEIDFTANWTEDLTMGPEFIPGIWFWIPVNWEVNIDPGYDIFTWIKFLQRLPIISLLNE